MKDAGGSLEGLQSGYDKVTKSASDAADGAAKQAAAYKQLGIDVLDSQGALKESKQLSEEIAASWANGNKSAEDRLALITAMGKSYRETLIDIEAVNAAEEMLNENLELGIGISEESQEAAANHESAMQELSTTSVSDELIKWFLDLEKGVVDFQTSIGGITPLILTLVTIFSSKLAPAIQVVGKLIGKTLVADFQALKGVVAGASIGFSGWLTIIAAAATVIFSVVGAVNNYNKAQKELREGQFDKMMQQQSLQEKITASVEKLKEVFVTLVQPLMPVLDAFASILSLISQSKTALLVLQTVMAGLAVKSIVTAIASIFTGSAVLGPIGLGIAAAATVGMMAMISSAQSKAQSTMKDGVIDPKKGPIVSGEFGSVQLHKDDQIVAGTNLFPEKPSISKPIQSNDGGITVLSSTLGNKMDVMIGKLDSLIGAVNRGMVVNLDGNKVSQELMIPQAINNRRT